ncbi:MAG: SDR family oxidoreductase [Gammaproteobacteria bacterium]|nr:SDR family oxidoreductase [Gammaproteobacteria bacterium]
MSAPVCLITGTTSGIGRVTARRLAENGFEVVMACRHLPRAEALRDALIKETRNAKIHVVPCDLASLESVRECAINFKHNHPRLDLLVNNAGMLPGRPRLSDDGFELTLATNYLGPYLLTRLLLDSLVASQPARIVNVASNTHTLGKLDLNRPQRSGIFSGMRVYAQAKLAVVMATISLAERLASTTVTANCLHPGVVATNIIPDSRSLLKAAAKLVSPLMLDAERGAKTTLHVALAAELANVSGKYFNQHQRIIEPAALAGDRALREHLWSVSERMVGLG